MLGLLQKCALYTEYVLNNYGKYLRNTRLIEDKGNGLLKHVSSNISIAFRL